MKEKKIRIAWLYPDLMSTYGDRGNIICLTKRCTWRNIPVSIASITLETPISKFEGCDVIFMGGAQDRQQKLASGDFLTKKGPVVKSMVEKGIPALFVCAAYQQIGHYYKPFEGDPIPGAGIFDLVTEHPGDQKKRLIGNVTAEILHPAELREKTIVGFENHGGRTALGQKLEPFARVTRGWGNNGEDGYEGAVYKNAIGSYFHGPLLPKNPYVADWLLTKALEIKYKENVKLSELDDTLEQHAHASVMKSVGV